MSSVSKLLNLIIWDVSLGNLSNIIGSERILQKDILGRNSISKHFHLAYAQKKKSYQIWKAKFNFFVRAISSSLYVFFSHSFHNLTLYNCIVNSSYCHIQPDLVWSSLLHQWEEGMIGLGWWMNAVPSTGIEQHI